MQHLHGFYCLFVGPRRCRHCNEEFHDIKELAKHVREHIRQRSNQGNNKNYIPRVGSNALAYKTNQLFVPLFFFETLAHCYFALAML